MCIASILRQIIAEVVAQSLGPDAKGGEEQKCLQRVFA